MQLNLHGNAQVPPLGWGSFSSLLQHRGSVPTLWLTCTSSGGSPQKRVRGSCRVFDGLWQLLGHDSCPSHHHSWASYAPSEGIKILSLSGNVLCECDPPQCRDAHRWTHWAREDIAMIKNTILPLQGVLLSAFCLIWLKTQSLQWWVLNPSFLYGSVVPPLLPPKYSFPHIQVLKTHEIILPPLQMTDCFVMNH